MEEGVFQHFTDLPLPLQHAVGAAALRCAQQQRQMCYEQQWQRRLQQTDDLRVPMSAVRLGCRPLRDGVDAARTRLRVTLEAEEGGEHRLQMLPMPVDAARFRGLKSLRMDFKDRRSVHLEGPPAWLQQLFISSESQPQVKLLSLPPGASMPQLQTLVLRGVSLPPVFDLAQFSSLQQLKLSYCLEVKHLANLASCSSLHMLEIGACVDLVSGLESDVLSQLQQLKQLDLTCRGINQLDMQPVSPSLTHLDVSRVGPIDLLLPGGKPRSALRHLGLHETSYSHNCDLSSVPNLETLSISSFNSQLPSVLDLSRVPHLKHLMSVYVQLQALDLSAVCSSLVSLHVTSKSLQSLDLTGCTALRDLSCFCSRQLSGLNLAPVAATLTSSVHTAAVA